MIWLDFLPDITIVSKDLLNFNPPEKADLLISNHLGSFGDDQLLPEQLDKARKWLKKDGCCIPSKVTSHINPVMSSTLYNQLRFEHKCKDRREVHAANPAFFATEQLYSTDFSGDVYHIAEAKQLFAFDLLESARDRCCFAEQEFKVKQDCVLNGFAGYFEAVLYDDITLSTLPKTKTEGLQMLPAFIPVLTPQQLKAGEELKVHFWRCQEQQRVWYEWSTSRPHISPIHNSRKHAFFMTTDWLITFLMTLFCLQTNFWKK